MPSDHKNHTSKVIILGFFQVFEFKDRNSERQKKQKDRKTERQKVRKTERQKDTI